MSSESLSEDTLYKELYEHLRGTDEVSFKLLGLVPLLSGTGILGLFWSKDSLPNAVVWLLALFAASVALALFRWELRNIDICWWLVRRIGAMEGRLAERIHGDELLSSKLCELRPPSGIDKPHAEALVYGVTVLVWLAVPWLHSWPPSRFHWLTAFYLAISALIGILTLLSVRETVITHHWPSSGQDNV